MGIVAPNSVFALVFYGSIISILNIFQSLIILIISASFSSLDDIILKKSINYGSFSDKSCIVLANANK